MSTASLLRAWLHHWSPAQIAKRIEAKAAALNQRAAEAKARKAGLDAMGHELREREPRLVAAKRIEDGQLVVADDFLPPVHVGEHILGEPPPSERARLWEIDDPSELARAAGEWERLGFTEYAEYLRAWARG